VVMIMGILAAIAVPRLQYTAVYQRQAEAAARKLVTDLRRTRSLAILNAADNTVGYALNLTGTSPYSAYEIENSDTHDVLDTHSFNSHVTVTCSQGNTFKFTGLGSLQLGGDSVITVSADGKSFTITPVAATGNFQIAEE